MTGNHYDPKIVVALYYPGPQVLSRPQLSLLSTCKGHQHISASVTCWLSPAGGGGGGCHIQPQLSHVSTNAEHIAEAAQKVESARSAAAEAQELLSKAEARAASAEEAKIELSLKLAELAALPESAADVSGMPKRAAEAEGSSDSLQKRYLAAYVSVCECEKQPCVVYRYADFCGTHMLLTSESL